MAKLYDASDNLLSKSVQVQPEPDPIKIENRLLSGSYDIQIIGDAAQIYSIEFYTTYADMQTIQTAYTQGGTLKLEHEGTDYTCQIKGKPTFRLQARGVAANRYYKGTMQLVDIS